MALPQHMTTTYTAVDPISTVFRPVEQGSSIKRTEDAFQIKSKLSNGRPGAVDSEVGLRPVDRAAQDTGRFGNVAAVSPVAMWFKTRLLMQVRLPTAIECERHISNGVLTGAPRASSTSGPGADLSRSVILAARSCSLVSFTFCEHVTPEHNNDMKREKSVSCPLGVISTLVRQAASVPGRMNSDPRARQAEAGLFPCRFPALRAHIPS